MVPFNVQVKAYQLLMKCQKVLISTIPFPKPSLFSGPGSSLQMAEEMGRMGLGKVLVVTDAQLLKLGLLDDILDTLKKGSLDFAIYDGVLPDPTIDQVHAGVELMKEQGCQAVLAVGGGSAMDCGKIIAAAMTNKKPVEKLTGLFKLRANPLPIFTIPTTAGTGSEVTIAAVISNPAAKSKNPIIDARLCPMMAALDPALMAGLPPHITAATGMDALTHAVEAYISANAIKETDLHAVAAVRLIMENLPKAYANGADLEAREHMARASYYAGLAFTKAGVGYVHAIAHNFGAYYHVPHGLANAIVLPHILEYSRDVAQSRLAYLAEVSGLKHGGESDADLAEAFIARIRQLSADMGIPARLDKLVDEDIPAIARAALKEAHTTYSVPKYMDHEVCEAVIGGMLPA
ncbi:MAG: iron-containing alcohol dehydrogenase [Alcanivorax sp.]|nr:iron-containing alcohol dehydrogenase [Alcanivorax sp.]